ncbi:diguanylate cyclase domain-containing protein [Deinococcus planocerae]|uniref:diguanylate cyclase domain-containing protein n=1 Tax=Deinococcus planocerae TaxID=1737569 RepID=UPI000C7F08C7|nr:GGDEF domain-containing protein [Deinococcus planocerae]
MPRRFLPSPGRPAWTAGGIAVALVAFGLAHQGWLLWGEPRHQTGWGNALYLPIMGLAAAMCAHAARRRRGARAGWAWLGVGLALNAAGEVIYAVLDARGLETFPSAADVAFLLLYPAWAHGLSLLTRQPGEPRQSVALTLDVLIGVSAALAFAWYAFLAPALLAPEHPVTARVVSAAYPLLDLVLLGWLLALLLRRGHLPPRDVLLAVGLGLWVTVDFAFLTLDARDAYFPGHPIDALWAWASVAFGLSAWVDARATATTRRLTLPRSVQMVVPYLALALAVGLNLATRPEATPAARGVTVATALVTLLVALRQLLALRENQRLTAALEASYGALAHAAHHDPLTGLPNRALFDLRLEEAAVGARREGRALALLFIDLDGFKAVNDALGHAAGDTLLVHVSGRLRAALREGDTVARLGGDEFAVILPDVTGPDEALLTARRAREAIETPLVLGEQVARVSASTGVSFSLGGGDLVALYREADEAMYHAKRGGKAREHLSTAPLPDSHLPGALPT